MSDQDPFDGLLARVAAQARAAGVGERIDRAAPLEGGHSGLTIGADLVDHEGASRRIVIKAAPPGRSGVGRHDVMRQARLFRVLAGFEGVRVPAVLFGDETDPPFFGMEFLEGEAVEPILADGLDLSPAEARARGLAAADMLAALHAPDPTGFELEAPRTIAQELARWSKTMAAVDPEVVAGSEELQTLLERSIPDEMRPSVIHGDFRLGNILCRGDELTGVIDWEIWGVADPRLDLGWFLVHFDPANYPGIAQDVPGLPPPEEVLARYETATGRPVTDWLWFDSFGRFKLAAIMGHNLRRHREGRHVDPFQERLPPTIERLITTGRKRLAEG